MLPIFKKPGRPSHQQERPRQRSDEAHGGCCGGGPARENNHGDRPSHGDHKADLADEMPRPDDGSHAHR